MNNNNNSESNLNKLSEYKNNIKDKLKLYSNYAVIFIVSLITLGLFPLIGSEMGLNLQLPNTVAGWFVYVFTKISTAIVNVLIFNSFMQQGKVNSKDTENYKKACEILNKYKDKEAPNPRSPSKFTAKEWLTKGTSIFISSVFSIFAISNAILNFDYISLIGYIITLIFGIVFGILQLAKSEEYWSNEFYQYALYVKEKVELQKLEEEKEQKLKEKENIKNDKDSITDISNNDICNSNDNIDNTDNLRVEEQKPLIGEGDNI